MSIFGSEKKKVKKEEQQKILNEYTVGVDIGSYSIKVFEVRRKEDGSPELVTYGDLELAAYDSLPPGSLAEVGEEKTEKALHDLFIASKINPAARVTFAIPTEECFVTAITVPKVSDAELNDIIPFEARKYLPIPISEVKLNYWRTEVANNVTDKKDTIMLAAVKKTTFELYEKYAKSLSLQNYSFEIESLSQARMVLRSLSDKNAPVVAVGIGAKTTFVSFIMDGIVHACNVVLKGSYENTFKISKVLSLPIEVAEEAKRIFGYLGDSSSPHLAEVMALASYPLFDEIKHLLLRYERQYNVTIGKVVLSGGGSLPKGIQEILSKFLDKDVELLDIFSHIEISEKMHENLKDTDREYSVAAGLALKYYS